VSTLTATRPIVQHPTAADRERALAVINAVMPTFATGMHCACLAELEHEAERLESLPPSRVVRSMRQIVDAELAAKRGAAC
jgi:hypothetical protein